MSGNPGSASHGPPNRIEHQRLQRGLYYIFATYTTTVDFGNGIVTAPTAVNVVLLSIPTSPFAISTYFSALLADPTTTPFEAYFGAVGVDGVLGVGPNAVGPGPSIPTMALPGDLNQECSSTHPQVSSCSVPTRYLRPTSRSSDRRSPPCT